MIIAASGAWSSLTLVLLHRGQALSTKEVLTASDNRLIQSQPKHNFLPVGHSDTDGMEGTISKEQDFLPQERKEVSQGIPSKGVSHSRLAAVVTSSSKLLGPVCGLEPRLSRLHCLRSVVASNVSDNITLPLSLLVSTVRSLIIIQRMARQYLKRRQRERFKKLELSCIEVQRHIRGYQAR